MGAVGLIYVGAVLFVNGAMLLGWVEGRSAAPLNLFVGVLQVITPTYLIFTANGNTDQILNASGLYLFGFTYLYVAFNLLMNLDGTGLGYFSLFVAVAAVAYSLANFFQLRDPVFGVIWLYWAFLWLLFYLLLGRAHDGLGRYTGAVAAVQGWVTGALPAALLLLGYWGGSNAGLIATIFAVAGIVVFAALWVPLRPRGGTAPVTTERTAAAT